MSNALHTLHASAIAELERWWYVVVLIPFLRVVRGVGGRRHCAAADEAGDAPDDDSLETEETKLGGVARNYNQEQQQEPQSSLKREETR